MPEFSSVENPTSSTVFVLEYLGTLDPSLPIITKAKIATTAMIVKMPNTTSSFFKGKLRLGTSGVTDCGAGEGGGNGPFGYIVGVIGGVDGCIGSGLGCGEANGCDSGVGGGGGNGASGWKVGCGGRLFWSFRLGVG